MSDLLSLQREVKTLKRLLRSKRRRIELLEEQVARLRSTDHQQELEAVQQENMHLQSHLSEIEADNERLAMKLARFI